MWVSKDGDVRKQELLDTALQLFEQNGYENTSINDIIKKVGVTKGAFYYYFQSKEDILNVLSEKQADNLIDIARQACSDDTLNALEKLNAIAATALQYKARNIKQRMLAYKAMQNESGILLGMRVLDKTIEKGRPIIQAILEQGVTEGVFDNRYTQDAAELYILLSSLMSSMLAKDLLTFANRAEGLESIHNKLLFYEDAFVRLLGIKNGRIQLANAVLKSL
jgi:AcrR family transcriptional regulator